MRKSKPIVTIVRYYRKPSPSCNWCPRYSEAYIGKDLIQIRLNDQSLDYQSSIPLLGYNCAANITHDFRIDREWSEILDIGENEVTVSQFRQFENRFKAAVKFSKGNRE